MSGYPSGYAGAESGLVAVSVTNGTGPFSSGTLVLEAGANITLTPSGNTLSIIGAAGGGGGVAISATDTLYTSGTVLFTGSGIVTVQSSGAGQTVIINATQSNQALSGQNGSFAFETASFSNANGISFGTSAGPAITASHNGLTSQSNQNVTAANGGFAFQTLSFSNANNFSFGTSAGSAITGSYTVPTVTNSSWTVSDNATSGTVARLAFTNLNGVTLSLSTGAAGSHTIVGSHNGLTTQTNQQMTMFATGNTTLSSTGTTNASSLVFRGSGAASVGITNGSVLIDVAAGAAAITQSIGMSTQTAGGATGGTTGYATGDDILYHFVPGSNITMSQSINGASGTLSIYGPAAGGGATLSGFDPWYGPRLWVASVLGNASLSVRAVDVPMAFQYDRMAMPINFTQSTASTVTMSVSVAWGFYTRNVSTLSLYKSGSGSFSINGSGTASSANNSGNRIVSFASTDTITAGNYYLGLVLRTSSAGGANQTLNVFCVSQFASSISGYIGVATGTRMMYHPAGGVWTSTTAIAPNSIAFSDIRGNSSAFRRQPVLHFTSGQITF